MSEKMKILVVDDDSDIRTCLIELLESEAYEVHGAINGQEALVSLKSSENRFDCIVLDLNMPVMDGYEFLKTLASLKSFSHLPVVIITASGRDEVHLKKNEKTFLLQKPFSVEALTRLIQDCTNK